MSSEAWSDMMQAWLSAESARRAVRLLMDTLGEDFEILVFKGVHLAYCVAEHPSLRPMSDADAVLTRGDPRKALATIIATGDWQCGESENAWPLQHRSGCRLDLHVNPLPPFFGHVDVQELRARSAPAPHEIFGPRVRIPSVVDAAALAIAHFVKEGLCQGDLARDLSLLASRGHIDPRRVASRLSEFRLRRSGIIALTHVVDEAPLLGPFRDALSPHPWERACARPVGKLLRRLGWSHFGWVCARLTTDRPADAFVGATSRIVSAIHRRVVRWRDTPTN